MVTFQLFFAMFVKGEDDTCSIQKVNIVFAQKSLLFDKAERLWT